MNQETFDNAARQLRELELQIMQNRTPKQITEYLNTILERRMRNLQQFLKSTAGQTEQTMIR